MRQEKVLLLFSPFKTNARFVQISLTKAKTYLTLCSIFTIFIIISILLIVVCSELLVRQKIKKLTRRNRALKSQILSYSDNLDTLYQHLDDYQDDLKYYELIAGIGNKEGAFVLNQAMPGTGVTNDSTIAALFAKAYYLGKLAEAMQQRQNTAAKSLKKKINEIAHLPVILPVEGNITSGFGMRRNPIDVGGPERRMHEGVDIRMPKGSPIFATANGVVVYAGWSDSYGNLIIIDHENGYYTYYAHCSVLKVKIDQKVRRNDIIALVGSTGRSTAPHVHYEVHKKKQSPVNPLDMLFLCTWG